MVWVFYNLLLIIAAAGAIAWWLNKRGQPADDGTPPPHQESTFDDPELAERTRRIREEIQRKIAERGRGYRTEQPTIPREPRTEQPPPIVREVIVPEVPPAIRRGVSAAEVQRQAEILEQQAAIAEQLREAELMKSAALKRAKYEAATTDHTGTLRSQARSSVLGDLRDPAALRRAFILREVLGPPVALR
jgi:hypothetical protein